MLKGLSEALSGIFAGRPLENDNRQDEFRLAAAALLVHAAAIDGRMSEAETARVHDLLKQRFNLSEEETHALLIAAERRERQATDLYGFTSKLKQMMNDGERQELISMMWEIAYADGELDALEDNLVWRAAELLGVPARDRMIMKKRVAGQQ